MTRTTFTRLIWVALAWTVVAHAAPAQIPGKIAEVTVYRGQALVTRDVQFDAKAGPQELIVTNLPEEIVPESLYATGEGNLAIRAVRHRTTAIEGEPRPEVRALDDQIKKRESDIQRIESELKVLQQRGQYLDKLEAFSADKIKDEQAKGSLNPKSLQDTAKFLFDQRDEIAQKQLKLQGDQEAAKGTLTVLQRQRATLAGGENKTFREAVVFLDAPQAGAARFKLSYLVDRVGWSPAYSASLSAKRDRLSLQYHAVVTQMSGEDWPDVKLTLSTSHPRMLAAAPVLSPLRITLVAAGGRQAGAAEEAKAYADKKRDLAQQLKGGRFGGGGVGAANRPAGEPGQQAQAGPEAPKPPGLTGLGQAEDEFLAANVLAAHLQNVELTAADEAVKMAKTMEGEATEGLAVDYPVSERISLQSRQDQQMFRIATLDLPATFYYTAMPLLTDYVYQAVEAVNDSETPLLPGPYNAYLESAFAGRGDLPLVARGQSFTIGFGTESQLRASRELEEKSSDTRGGNKVAKYTYRLRLQNFMAQPVTVRVWDRLPQAPDNQVTVTLSEPKSPLSTDATYVAYERPRGLLRWDVEVPAHAAKADAFSFTYQFQMEFDKSFAIGELPAQVADQMRSELQTLRNLGAFGAAKK